MQNTDSVVAQISGILRPYCDLSEAELAHVAETVLLLGARHALRWVEPENESTGVRDAHQLAYAERD